ncbi:L-threonylcarbamoyladenylate synthase [Algirhabdus cladophorae]|uniref:L-threonylcarbamoyladenylate synthase n=1 Tax=Algirhabdus cladophorae TaxID=3377108 RepID=UPI003B84A6EC
MIKTEILGTNPTDIAKAAAMLQRGDLLGLPTETVYGLGADARNAQAVAGIFAAKGRPSFNPLIVHVSDFAMAQQIGGFDDVMSHLARNLWPGPLTLVVPVRPSRVADLVTAGQDTVAIRVPAHPVAHAILTAFGGPIAAPSANPSGQVSATTAAHVMAGLGGKVAGVVDAGPCAIGLESTIVSGAQGGTILRSGGVSAETLAALLGHDLANKTTPSAITAPGQLASHYAPKGTVRLNVHSPEPDETYVGFGAMDCDFNLSEKGDLTEAAANLFATLHALNAQDAAKIAVAPVPETGLGAAINDRLRRAAAPR